MNSFISILYDCICHTEIRYCYLMFENFPKMLQPHYNIIIVYKLTGGPGGPAGPCGPWGPLNHKKDRFKDS